MEHQNRSTTNQPEQEKLQRELAMMRMICDSNYILDREDRVCPKLVELERLLEECRSNDAKVIVFSEWERMLELVRDLCERRGFGFAWHTGSVPQKRRRAEINVFKNDPECRIFLSTDSGATGLNLQNASVVINCDLPWNPARLEQRIALGPAGFDEETRTNLLQAIHLLGCALAVQNRYPEPTGAKEALLPPLAQSWNGKHSVLASFVDGTAISWKPVVELLEGV